jgi:uncharacterized protein YdeI (YjbR/CyaY-like superfamily)
MTAVFFKTQAEFRKWLTKNSKKETELIVGFYKLGSGKPSITWSEAVDQALCFGWIDGIRRSIDAESYSNRFTPRRKTSIWSDINVKKVKELRKAGKMKPEGLKAFSYRSLNKSGIYSHENKIDSLGSIYEKEFKKNKIAWDFFSKQAPSYRKQITHWIMTAKQEKTRLSRLEKTIKTSALQKRMA